MKVNSYNLLTREVWSDNLDEEVAIIRKLVQAFPYIAMDTEFPGVVPVSYTHLTLPTILLV